MTFEEKMNEELKVAMKSGDKIRMETIRSIRSAIIEFNKSGANRELNSDDELKILQSAAKKRKDAIEMYEKTTRTDLLEREQAELKIIEEFLPKKLSENEVKEIIKNVIEQTGAKEAKDMGKVMGPLMKEIAGRADGKVIQGMVRELLS
jgi:uncharacterized protein YqeY